MTTAPVVDLTGASQGELELPETVFSVIPHATVMHQALLRQLANARQGTHDSKTRTEVSGGGRKPYRQKGTGRARQGSIRAPHYAGGGTVFGPTPRDHSLQMPRKQRRLALRSALSVKAAESQITVLDRIELEEPKTKVVTGFLQALEAGRRVLVVLGSHHDALEMSARNLPEVRVILAGNISVRDLLTADTVVIDVYKRQHLAWDDDGDIEVLAAGGATGETAQHGQLAHVREGVGYRSLEQALDRRVQWPAGGEKGIEGAQRGEEPLLLVRPGEGLGGIPVLLANRGAQRPVEEIAHVGQNLHRQSADAVKAAKMIGRPFKSPCGPIGQCCQSVAQQFAFLVHTGNYNPVCAEIKSACRCLLYTSRCV